MRTLFEADMEGGLRNSVALLTEPEEVGRLLSLFEAIASELGWQPGEQLWTYRACAAHLAAIVDGKIVGGLQAAIAAELSELPYKRVWPEVGIGMSSLHVTILALERQYRGRSRLFGSLCVELWRWCVARNVRQIVIEATPPTLRLYQRIGWPLEIIGGLRAHWGEECYLCRMDVEQVAEALVRKASRSISHRALVEQAYRDRAMPPLTGASDV